MLITFALDSDAIPISAPSKLEERRLHRRFLAIWDKVGVFVSDNEEIGKSSFIRAIREREDGPIRKLWTTSLNQRRWITEPDLISDLDAASTLSDLTSFVDKISVAFLETSRAEKVGIDPSRDRITAFSNKVELCRFEVSDDSDFVRRAQNQISFAVPAGHTIDILWEDHFALIGRSSRHLTIVDQYAVLREHGLTNLLGRLSSAGSNVNVEVVSAISENLSTDEFRNAAERITAEFAETSLGRIRFHPLNSGDFTMAHPRHLRFDRTVYWIDQGVEIFEDDTLPRLAQISRQPRNEIVNDHESGLLAFCCPRGRCYTAPS